MSADGKRRGKAADRSWQAASRSSGTRMARTGRGSRAGQNAGSSAGATVVMQARVDADFAAELLEHDAPALGLEGISALVREGLRLLHKRAREFAAAAEYGRFYGGQPAPLPDAVIPADAD